MSALQTLGVTEVPGRPVAGVQGPRGVGIACGCGRWSAFVTGTRSAQFAGRSYREHTEHEAGR